jgi:dUTP pyrophosphatase
MEEMVIVEKMPGCQDIPLPVYATQGASGVDLYAAFEEEFIILWTGQRKLIPSGLMIQVPKGHEAQIRPRSGLALKKGISIVNSPGTIDSDYRGPVGIIIINHGEDQVRIDRGDKIAQMVIMPVLQAAFVEGKLDDTERGAGGFGSTGT